MPAAIQQIQGWQIARKKIPSWAAVEGIVYPPHLNMEQCSSEQTARYKADIAGGGQRLVDLTGGFGIDFAFMSQRFKEAVYVEQNPQLCAISSKNFELLGLRNTEVVCADCCDYLKQMEPATTIYIDPARRDTGGKRTYAIADCTPNIIDLLPLMLQKSDNILIKLSPMLDWHKAVEDLQQVTDGHGSVNSVNIIGVGNECKELLIEIAPSPSGERLRVGASAGMGNGGASSARDGAGEGLLQLCLKTDNGDFTFYPFRPDDPSAINVDVNVSVNSQFFSSPSGRSGGAYAEPDDFVYLYEPHAVYMKAGHFEKIFGHNHPGLKIVSKDSHLLVSRSIPVEADGRVFRITGMSSLNKHDLKRHLAHLTRANISVRNFPLTAEQLRKRLKLKDGGDDYIFGTTLKDGSHVIIVCKKI